MDLLKILQRKLTGEKSSFAKYLLISQEVSIFIVPSILFIFDSAKTR